MSSNESLKSPHKIYNEEKEQLLIERKYDLMSKLDDVYNSLSTKENIYEFLKEGKEEINLNDSQFQKAKNRGKFKLFLSIKILGLFLFTTHLISLFEINDIINAIEEELLASTKSYLKKIDRKPTDDFYQNFNRLNNKIPDYSVFYLSSLLSECLNGCIGYEWVALITTLIISSILFFSFKDYEFNIDRNNYKNYSLKDFIYLYIIYASLSFFEGIVALYPLNKIKNFFILYGNFKEEIQKEKKKKKIKSKMVNHQIK